MLRLAACHPDLVDSIVLMTGAAAKHVAARRAASVGEVDADGGQIGSKAADGRGMTATTERVESRVRIIAIHDVRSCRTHAASVTDSYGGVGRQVAHVAGMAALLGNDPSCRTIDVDPDHGAPRPLRPPTGRLEDHVARCESEPGHHLHRWVDQVALQQSDTLAPSHRSLVTHASSLYHPQLAHQTPSVLRG